ncbi:hypothetical protein [Actinomadura sp. 6N118]|uniref:hypothetical protein n=1 Tax=Actinomadura sp. 6N118 TaxID=3375151 RepID=UPI0037B55DB7
MHILNRIYITPVTVADFTGLTGLCLNCWATHSVTPDQYPELEQWAQRHICGLEHAASGAITGTSAHVLACLYCGATDDISEVLVTIDERTSEYALRCGLCDGMWAA